uniref:Uncharacterized protein n=1 Tax=Labrus bergylta TaxID=56723 RepID=A0A3Q3L405_9LABR
SEMGLHSSCPVSYKWLLHHSFGGFISTHQYTCSLVIYILYNAPSTQCMLHVVFMFSKKAHCHVSRRESRHVGKGQNKCIQYNKCSTFQSL